MLGLGELEVKRKCSLVQFSGRQFLSRRRQCLIFTQSVMTTCSFSVVLGARRGASARAIRAGAAHGQDVGPNPCGIGPGPKVWARAAARTARCAV